MIERERMVNAFRIVRFSDFAMQDMEQILKLFKKILSAPFTEEQCETLLNTIIDIQFGYSDDMADFEDVLRATLDYLNLLEIRLGLFTPDPF